MSDENLLTPNNMVKAAYEGNLNLVKTMIESGISPDATDNSRDHTPAIVAAAHSSRYEIVDYLLSQGANPNNYADDGPTALGVAAGRHNYNIVKLLLQYKANPDHEDYAGGVALTSAIDYAGDSDYPLVELLLHHTNTKYYQKAYEHAVNEKIRKLIVETGVPLFEPPYGFIGPDDRYDIKCNTPPTGKYLRLYWELLTIYENLYSYTGDPNDLWLVYMVRHDIGGSTDEVTYDELEVRLNPKVGIFLRHLLHDNRELILGYHEIHNMLCGANPENPADCYS